MGRMAEDDDLVTAMIKAQEGNGQWGGSLIETGGEQNPDKCAFTVGHMIPEGKGPWRYHDSPQGKENDGEDQGSQKEEQLRMTVPQVGGRAMDIKHLKSSEAVENLGLFARPDGDCSNHLRQLAGRIEDWTTRVKTAPFPQGQYGSVIPTNFGQAYGMDWGRAQRSWRTQRKRWRPQTSIC